jgi:hypothetical protein
MIGARLFLSTRTLLQISWMLIGLLWLASCRPASGEDVVLSRGELRIPAGKSVSFDLGTLPQRESTVLLDLLARSDAEGYGGSNYLMKISLNGRVIGAARTRTATRLRDKKLVSPVSSNLRASWFGSNAWRVVYAPNFIGALKYPFYEGNPYRTVLDVTDLVNPAGTNKLEIANTAKSPPAPGAKAGGDLVLKNPTLRVKSGASPMLSPATVDQDVINRGTPGAGPAPYTGRLLPGGGFTITVGKRTLRFGSRISYPGAGYNQLAASETPLPGGQSGFRVAATATTEGGRVVAKGPDYDIVRTVRFTTRKVEIVDRITNLRREKLGVSFADSVGVGESEARVRLAGNPDNSVNEYYSPGNPSVYLATPDRGVGIIIEDDVFRNQATLFYDSDAATAGVRTDRLCLPPGGSYTLQWSVYPVASDDYYDFVNLVRQDWGANYTVEGAWTFFRPDAILAAPVAEIREKFHRLGIKRACVGGGWVDSKGDRTRIGFGAGVLESYWSDYRDRIRRAAARIRQADPDCKVYLYYNTQRDTSAGGEERFRDSLMTDEKGAPVSTDWGGVFSRTVSVVATPENSFGKAMLAVADRYLREMKVDGLYWDEMEAVGFGQPLVTYNVPDGYSCELDPESHAVKREVGISTILGERHRLAVTRKVREQGGDIMGNGPIATKGMLALKPQRMVEIQHNDYWNYEGNLGSPLGYAAARSDFGNWVRALDKATLLVGTRYDYAYDIERYVFPFTPIELHAGYLLGRERIIATHSGNYGWSGDNSLCQTYYFNRDGKLTDRSFSTQIGKEARTKVDIAQDEAIVMVRVPVLITVNAGQATVTSVKYDDQKLVFSIRTDQGSGIELRSGAMKVTAGRLFQVNIGGFTSKARSDSDGVLRIPLRPAPDSVPVEIRPL